MSRRSAQTTYHVQTGGRAIPGMQSLWCFSGGASLITNKHALPPFWLEPMQAINPTLVQIRGQSLDTNGTVYIVLPDGQDMDVTPQVPGVEFYTFGVSGQKYEIVSWTHHPALTDTDRGRQNLGVGEEVDLSGMPANTAWSASAGGIVTNANGVITFTAPSNAVLTVVTASVATVTGDSLQITKEFQVFEPSGYDAAHSYIATGYYERNYNTAPPSYYGNPPQAGAYMQTFAAFAPLNVSFYKVFELDTPTKAPAVPKRN